MIILGKMGEGAIIMRLFKIWNIDNIFEIQIYVFTQSQSFENEYVFTDE